MSNDKMELTDRARAGSTNRRWTRLIPVILVIYIIAYIDRVNIGFGMGQIREPAHGCGPGRVRGGHLLHRLPGAPGARRLPRPEMECQKGRLRLMLGWGLCAILAGFVANYGQLLTARFMLGVFEGGVQPALMVLINRWFPKSEKGRAFSLFIMHNPIATVITAPLAGLILMHGSWRELFVIQGLLPLLIGVGLWLWVAADDPAEARWLSAQEAQEIATLKAADGDDSAASNWRAAVKSPYVWLLALMGMLVWLGFYGLQLWLPTLLKTVFKGELTVGLVAAIPPICAAAAIWINGRGADRDGRYNVRVAVPLIVGGVILATSTLITANQPWLVVLALAAATACQLSFFGPYWTMNSTLVRPEAVGAGFGIINGIGNLGGLLGPYVGGWIQDTTGSLALASVFFGCSVILAGIMALALRGAVRRRVSADS